MIEFCATYNALFCEYTISQEHSLLLEVVLLVFFLLACRTHTVDLKADYILFLKESVVC